MEVLPVKTARSVAVHISGIVTIANSSDRTPAPQGCPPAVQESCGFTINPKIVSGSRCRQGLIEVGINAKGLSKASNGLANDARDIREFVPFTQRDMLDRTLGSCSNSGLGG